MEEHWTNAHSTRMTKSRPLLVRMETRHLAPFSLIESKLKNLEIIQHLDVKLASQFSHFTFGLFRVHPRNEVDKT